MCMLPSESQYALRQRAMTDETTRAAEQDNVEVWVEIETNKDTSTVNSYRGRTTRAEVEAWSADQLGRRALRLRDAYWVEDIYGDDPLVLTPTGQHTVVLGQGPGRFANYSGEILIRADTIAVILVLKNGDERDGTEPKGRVVRLAPKEPESDE